MKKSTENKQDIVQLIKNQTKQLPEPHSNRLRGSENDREKRPPIPKKFKENQTENLEAEFLRSGYKNSDSETDIRNPKLIKSISKSGSWNVKTFLQQHSQQLQNLASKGYVLKNFSENTVKMKMNDFSYPYPAERIKLSHKEKSIEDTSLSVKLSENLFNDISFIDSQKESCSTDEKLYRVTLKRDSEPDDIKYMNPGLKKIRKRKFRAGKIRKALRAKEAARKIQPTSDPKKSELIAEVTDESKCIGRCVSEEEDLATKQHLLDFFFYIIFLTIITVIALCMVSSTMFYFTDITTSMFFTTAGFSSHSVSFLTSLFNDTSNKEPITLQGSKTIDDFWIFAQTTLLDRLYWSFFYTRPDSENLDDPDHRKMLHENQILGVARLRQLRVKNDSCEIHPDIQRFFNSCYYYYSVFAEDSDPIKLNMENTSTATAWKYTEAKKLNTSYYWGEISVYGGGGYYLDLATNRMDAELMIQELISNSWISRATRALFIDFNVYNANVNLFCICKIVLEFPPAGGILPTANFQTLKLIRYLRPLDFFVLGLEIIYVLLVFYYTFRLFKGVFTQKWYFFFFFWNYINVVIITLSYANIFLSVIRYVYSKNLISVLSDRHDKYTEFDEVKNIQIMFNNCIAILLFFCWMKLFKFLDFNTVLMEFKLTLAKSLIDILWFFPMFLTMFLAFTFVAYLLFGSQLKKFKTLWLSFLTLLQAFLGEFYYAEIIKSSRILGPLFYVTYIFFIFFVLLNVFIAIINDAYTTVKSQVYYEKPMSGEYMKRGFWNLFTCGRIHTSEKMRLKKIKKNMLFQEIKLALRKAGFSTTEINVFFYKYNINFSNFLDDDSRTRLLKDLELRRIDFSESSEQVQINSLSARIDNLSKKLEDVEMHLQPVVEKVDHIIKRLRKD